MGDMDPLAELITTYNELNASVIAELDEEPSPLEFMRFVATNTPFVVRRGARHWPATQTWTANHLLDALRGHAVNVAVTPYGNADAPTRDARGDIVFAKPHEEDQPFDEFLAYLTKQELDPAFRGREIRYAQTQNDNLRNEYRALFSQVQKDIPFARIALRREPDAINLWIGNARSVTALHRDNYENVYVQVTGRKSFVLLPPLCQPCVNEHDLPPAHYERRRRRRRRGEGPPDDDDDNEDDDLVLVMDDEGAAPAVPFATWDPDHPAANATPYSPLASPVRVVLDPGDMLYLPAMWYHKVSQTCSDEGICVAVNYWYDMEFSGPQYPLTSFVRNVSLAAKP